MRRVLVTGGAGFIGSNLIKKIIENGYDVSSLDNYSTGKIENEVPGANYINDDIDNAILMWSNILRIMRKNELLEKFNDLKILKPNDSPFITHYQYKETECEICDNYNSFKEWLDLIRFNIIPVLKNQIYQDYGPEEWNYDYFQDSGDESDESEIIVEF